MSNTYPSSFNGIARLYGHSSLKLFSRLHISIIGIGGVGSWAAEALARTGIGHITLVDMDDICITNTNRQIHATRETLGQAKIQVMMQRIKAINPNCEVYCIDDFLTLENIALILNRPCHYIIDAIDQARVKAALIAHCRRYKIPIITTGGAGGKQDPTRIQVVDLAQTFEDPLARKVRAKLKTDFHLTKNSRGKLGIPCVSSHEPLVYPQADGTVCQQATVGPQRMDCTTGLGATTVVTATFGFVAVAHVLKNCIKRAQNQS